LARSHRISIIEAQLDGEVNLCVIWFSEIYKL